MNKRDKEEKDIRIKSLEEEKLIVEIKNLKQIWRHPSFWPPLFTFLLVLTATIYSWKSGIFEIKSEKLELETAKLELKKDTLNSQIEELNSKYFQLINRYESVKYENDSIKKVMEKWVKTKQSKSDLYMLISVKEEEV